MWAVRGRSDNYSPAAQPSEARSIGANDIAVNRNAIGNAVAGETGVPPGRPKRRECAGNGAANHFPAAVVRPAAAGRGTFHAVCARDAFKRRWFGGMSGIDNGGKLV